MAMAGIISDVGNGVDDFKVGDEVYGCGFKGIPGALSEFALADTKLLKKPRNLMVEAALFPSSDYLMECLDRPCKN